MQVQEAFLGVWELVAILVIVLILFGPKRLPEIGKAVGSGMKEFKNATGEGKEGESEKRPG